MPNGYNAQPRIVARPPISQCCPKRPFETLARLQQMEWRVAAIKRPDIGERWRYEGTLCSSSQQYLLRLSIECGVIIACTEIMPDRTQIYWIKRAAK